MPPTLTGGNVLIIITMTDIKQEDLFFALNLHAGHEVMINQVEDEISLDCPDCGESIISITKKT